jgi:hypothetical protein
MRFVPLLLLALAGPVAAQGVGDFVRQPGGWRWSRGQVSIVLEARTACWADAEAEAVHAALDKLPDVLLRRAFVQMRITRFYRDDRARNAAGVRPAGVRASTAVESGFISFASTMFEEGWDPLAVYATVTHELGHCAQYSLLADNPILAKARAKTLGTPGWTSISWTNPITDGLRTWNGFVSDYARTDDGEDFAESVEFYWLAPDELHRVNARKFAFMRDVVFHGAVSPLESRKPDHIAIDPVCPEIERLGDREDDAGSLVKVHGRHFMGPLDGGFNTVRYRGSRALHLATSRSTLWSWVPGISRGSAPITVTTQDGTSAPAAFTVSKPWWKFW